MARNVLVVGASGLLGQQITKKRTRIQYIISKSRVEKANSAIENANNIVSETLSNECSAILFLAWPSNSISNYDKLNDYEIWINTCFMLAKLALEKNVHFFMVGSCLDKNPTLGNFYAAAKSELKNLLSLEIAERQITWFRPFYIFNIDPARPRILQELLADKNGELVIQSPNTFNDYVHLEDVSTGMSKAIENDLRGQIDIGSGFLTSNRAFVDAMSRQLKFNVPIYAEDIESRGDFAEIEQLLCIGWSPSRTLEFFCSEREFE